MGAVLNGLSVSKVRPFGATFFIFSDYLRPAMRLSALMELPTIFIFTHRRDGRRRGRADAPAGRAARVAARDPGPDRCCVPGMPTRWSRRAAIAMPLQHKPGGDGRCRASRCRRSTAASTRPRRVSRTARMSSADADAAGGTPDGDSDRLGQRGRASRCDAHEALVADGIRSRVVSMPSWDIFDCQPQEYRDSASAARGHGACGDRAGIHIRRGNARSAAPAASSG